MYILKLLALIMLLLFKSVSGGEFEHYRTYKKQIFNIMPMYNVAKDIIYIKKKQHRFSFDFCSPVWLCFSMMARTLTLPELDSS